MQRERVFPETIDLNQGSFPDNTSMETIDSWDMNVNPVENRSSGNVITYTNADDNSQRPFGWNHRESSSSADNMQEHDSNIRLGWQSSFNDCFWTQPREDWLFGPSSTSSSNRASLNINANHGPSETEQIPPFCVSSSNNLENNDSTGLPFGTWGSSCKRKTLEGTSRQYYPGGSSSSNAHGPGYGNLAISSRPLHLSPAHPSEHINLRNGIATGNGAHNFFPSPSVPRMSEGLTRNFTVRSNLVHHDAVPLDAPPRGPSLRDAYAARQRSRHTSNANSLDLRSGMQVPINQIQSRSIHANETMGTRSFRWNRSLSSPGSSSSSSFMGSGEGGSRVREEANSEYPVMVSTRNLPHDLIDWSFAPESSASSRNLMSGSRIGSSSGWQAILPLQNQAPESSQVLGEADAWFPSSSHVESNSGIGGSHFEFLPLGTSSPSLEAALTSRTQHSQDQRSPAFSVDRPSDTVSSWRGLASVESRHRLIHQLLNAMRRGGRLQPEDYVLIDPYISEFAELNDRHRDLRLDVDNMSYEELLALEDQIGNVNTGLSDEKITVSMTRRKYKEFEVSMNMEPCCICQEDYSAGEDVGILDCEHEFHTSCIKQWLLLKNLCPICKMTALKT